MLAKQSGCGLRKANGPILGRPPMKRSHSARSDDSAVLFLLLHQQNVCPRANISLINFPAEDINLC